MSSFESERRNWLRALRLLLGFFLLFSSAARQKVGSSERGGGGGGGRRSWDRRSRLLFLLNLFVGLLLDFLWRFFFLRKSRFVERKFNNSYLHYFHCSLWRFLGNRVFDRIQCLHDTSCSRSGNSGRNLVHLRVHSGFSGQLRGIASEHSPCLPR